MKDGEKRMSNYEKKVPKDNLEQNDAKVSEKNFENKALLTVKDLCTYLSIGDTTARKLLKSPESTFTVRIGKTLYAHKDSLDIWLKKQCAGSTV